MKTELFHIIGYKCFADQIINLGQLTILVGANGNGKSSTIQSLLLFKLAASGQHTIDLNHAFGLRLGRFCDILNPNNDGGEIKLSLLCADNRQEKATCLIKSCDSDESLYVQATYNSKEKDYLWYRQEIYYLSAEREGPRISQDLVKLEYLNTGIHGENTAQAIAEKGSMTKVDEERMFDNTKNRNIDAQVNFWLDFIFPKISVSSSINRDVLQARVKVSNSLYSDAFTTNMGFGVSYALPIIVDGLLAKRDSLFIVENPEAHLHPAAQTAMGYFLAKMSYAGVRIIVETHSDHLIDGVQLFVVKHGNWHNNVIINNYSIEDGEIQPKVEPIFMSNKGEYDRWPKGFMDQSQINYYNLQKYRRDEIK